MLGILKKAPTPMPEATLQAGLEGRKRDMVAALRYLVGTHQVERSGEGKRGNPYVYWLDKNAGSRAEILVPETAKFSGSPEPEIFSNFGPFKALSPEDIAGSGPIPVNREPESCT